MKLNTNRLRTYRNISLLIFMGCILLGSKHWVKASNCGVCEDPEDPSLVLGGAPPCKPKPDGVLDDCVSRDEQVNGGGYCISSWVVGGWELVQSIDAYSFPCVVEADNEKYERIIEYTYDSYNIITCVKTWTECQGGVAVTVDDWPGTLVEKQVIDQVEHETKQTTSTLRICWWTCSIDPNCSYNPPLPTGPPQNPNPCDYTGGGSCAPCQ